MPEPVTLSIALLAMTGFILVTTLAAAETPANPAPSEQQKQQSLCKNLGGSHAALADPELALIRPQTLRRYGTVKSGTEAQIPPLRLATHPQPREAHTGDLWEQVTTHPEHGQMLVERADARVARIASRDTATSTESSESSSSSSSSSRDKSNICCCLDSMECEMKSILRDVAADGVARLRTAQMRNELRTQFDEQRSRRHAQDRGAWVEQWLSNVVDVCSPAD